MNARSTLRGLRNALSLAVAVLLVGVSLPATVFAQPENVPRFIGEQVIASWRAYPPTADEMTNFEIQDLMPLVRGDNYDFVRQIQAQQAERGRQPLSELLRMLVENRVISALDTIYFRTLSNAQNADQARAAAQQMRASESLRTALLGAIVIHLIEQSEAQMYANTAADAADGISWGELAGAAAAGAGIGALIGGAGGYIGAAVAVAVAIYGQLFGGGDGGDDDDNGNGDDGGGGGDGGGGSDGGGGGPF